MLQIEMPGQWGSGLHLRQLAELVEDEAAIRGADVAYWRHVCAQYAGLQGLPDNAPVVEQGDRRLVRVAERDDHVAATGKVRAESRVLFAWRPPARKEQQDWPGGALGGDRRRRAGVRVDGAKAVEEEPGQRVNECGQPPLGFEVGNWWPLRRG